MSDFLYVSISKYQLLSWNDEKDGGIQYGPYSAREQLLGDFYVPGTTGQGSLQKATQERGILKLSFCIYLMFPFFSLGI